MSFNYCIIPPIVAGGIRQAGSSLSGQPGSDPPWAFDRSYGAVTSHSANQATCPPDQIDECDFFWPQVALF